MLRGVGDAFGGVVCGPGEVPERAADFGRALASALRAWTATQRRGVWLELPGRLLASHAPVALQHGFRFHHADAEHAVLTRWLPRDEPDKLPGGASHYVGVGGFVLRNAAAAAMAREMLVVRERYVAGTPAHAKMWKLPGGLVEPGESLGDAAVREVREETGVRTRFESVVCFRHLPIARFGRYGDLYFVAKLRLHDEAAPGADTLCPDPVEIADARWMAIDEYLRHKHTPELMRRIVLAAVAPGGDVSRPVQLPVMRPDGPSPEARRQWLYAFGPRAEPAPKL